MSSSINALNNSSYYQLSDPSAGPGGNNVQSNPTSALLQALGTTSSDQVSPTSSSSDAYVLDLSPEAQQLMNGASSSTGNADSALGSSSQSFILTDQQQQTIATILAKYKDAPDTQATFDDIQNDLQAAGLDPTTLSRIDQAQSFNPTQLFVDDLNGDYSGASAITDPNESQKASNYMQQIITEWQDMSGNQGAAAASTSTSSPTSATSSS